MKTNLALKHSHSYAERQRAHRVFRRVQANRAVQKAVLPGSISDPLARASANPNRRRLSWGALLGSFLLHGILVYLGASSPKPASPPHRPLTIEVVSAPPPPPPVTPPPEKLPPPVRTEHPRVIPKLRKTPPPPQPAVPEDKPQPPPDPVAVETPPPPSPTPARRIVGLNFESTVSTGSGPAFAVGNTRMGDTANTAVAPDAVKPAAPSFTPAVRTNTLSPDYPTTLRSRGIQGEVGLSVEIDAAGTVRGVEIVTPSEFDEFNRAAVAAAWRTTYEPARVNGVAISNVIRFTVRFRLHD